MGKRKKAAPRGEQLATRGCTVDERVAELFSAKIGDRASRLERPVLSDVQALIVDALADTQPAERAREIAFHSLDWLRDAAFLVALGLFPEKFTKEEVASGITSLLIHVPNHLAAAAKLAGWPVQDIFGVGALAGE